MLLLSLFLAVQAPADSVQIVTRDIANFWRAYDSATGKADAEQARIFRTVYLQPGSPGLRDWTRLRLMNRDTVIARMNAAGWDKARLDSLSHDSLDCVRAPFAEQSGAEELVLALRTYPRYYAAVRGRTLSVDTNSAIRHGIRLGLTKLAELYPEARFANIYFLIGTLSTGGTAGRSGMLIGTEQYGSGPDTPRDELPGWAQAATRANNFESIIGLVVHEAVHNQQKPGPPGQANTLLRQALAEGIADLLAELAVGPSRANTPRVIYGRAHEHDVWVDFQDEMEIAVTR